MSEFEGKDSNATRIIWSLSDFYCGEVRDFEELCQAFHLVYKQYKDLGYICSNEEKSKMRFGLYQLFPVSQTCIAKYGSTYCGTVSVVADSHLGLPADSVFHSQLDRLRQENRRLAETTMLSCIPILGKKAGEISAAMTYQSGFWWQNHHEVDDSIIIVNPRHIDFWEKAIGYKVFGMVKHYGSVQGAPGYILRLDIKGIREEKIKPTPIVERSFNKFSLGKKKIVPKFRITSEHVIKLLVNNPQIILEASSKQRAILKQSFPDLFILWNHNFKNPNINLSEKDKKMASGYLAPTPQWLRGHPIESRMLQIDMED